MLTVVGMGSPNVLKVLLFLEEAGLPYRFERCDVILGEQHFPGFTAFNPNRKVPVLVDDEGDEPLVIAESGAILVYLAERTGAFLPRSGAARYAVLQWLMFQMSGIGPVFGHTIHLTSFAAGETYAVRRFTRELARLVTVMEERLSSREYLAGDDYSIADIAAWPWMRTGKRFFPDGFSSPALARWMEAIAARPAATRMEQIADDLAARDRESFKAATPEQLDRYFGR
ncbi:MAG: glutathione S-transferase N-terminal domain-containing protein [Novosphingobium sp.]|nr:glutathione S-transferase N-terminal domain-containing protein [Novosphingobium sp.]